MNSFYDRTDGALRAAGTVAGTVLSTQYAAYGLEKSLADALGDLSDNFQGQLDSAKLAHAASIHATGNKDAGRAELLGLLAQVSNVLYGPASTVTDAQLAQIGFAPRPSRSKRPIPAQTVTGVTAVPDVSGKVTIEFDRGSNSRTASYQIFRQGVADTAWTYAATTPRAKIALTGYAPGVPMWFRIVTTAGATVSEPSETASIYAPDSKARGHLKLAS